MKRGINLESLFLSFILVYAVALVGCLFTAQGLSTGWYEAVKPPFAPPNWVFSVVWNILFFLIALSLYFVMVSKKSRKAKQKVYIFFGINLLLNVAWSFFYFFLKNPALAFAEWIFLWISVISMIIISFKVSPKSSWLLMPYLLWISFAGILNYLSAFG